MSQSPKYQSSPPDLGQMRRYLAGDMPASEQAAFEQKVAEEPLAAGERVRVLSRDGLTLRVGRDDAGDAAVHTPPPHPRQP